MLFSSSRMIYRFGGSTPATQTMAGLTFSDVDISSLHALKIAANYLKASPQMEWIHNNFGYLKPDQQVAVYRYCGKLACVLRIQQLQ